MTYKEYLTEEEIENIRIIFNTCDDYLFVRILLHSLPLPLEEINQLYIDLIF